jgi:hypothetical protein
MKDVGHRFLRRVHVRGFCTHDCIDAGSSDGGSNSIGVDAGKDLDMRQGTGRRASRGALTPHHLNFCQEMVNGRDLMTPHDEVQRVFWINCSFFTLEDLLLGNHVVEA